MTQLARGRSGRQGELGLGRGRAEARRCPGREPRACAGPARGGRHDRQGFGFGSGEPTGSRDRPACASESGRLVPGAAEVAARMQKARGGTAKGKRPKKRENRSNSPFRVPWDAPEAVTGRLHTEGPGLTCRDSGHPASLSRAERGGPGPRGPAGPGQWPATAACRSGAGGGGGGEL